METPIQKGQYVGGRLFFAIPGDRSQQIKALQHIIDIECRDYLGKIATARYKPSPTPPKSLLGHYKEKREIIKEEAKEEPNALKQPASAASMPDPPRLGDGS